MNTIISQLDSFNQIVSNIKKDGWSNLHVLADFDRTLTVGLINGIKTPSIIALLRDGNHLIPGYAEKAQALFDKYHPIEIDLKLSQSIKKNKMEQWWQEHNKLLIESCLKFSDLEDVAQNNDLKFREGVLEFLDFLKDNNIPLIIMSASGCGEAIKLFFKRFERDYSNISYIINRFNWNKSGEAISVVKPIVHSLNKDKAILKDFPEIWSRVKDRKNVLLLGDSLDDVEMITGFDYDNLLKIGFSNFACDKNRQDYKEKFDVVLEGDGDFNFVNNLLFNL